MVKPQNSNILAGNRYTSYGTKPQPSRDVSFGPELVIGLAPSGRAGDGATPEENGAAPAEEPVGYTPPPLVEAQPEIDKEGWASFPMMTPGAASGLTLENDRTQPPPSARRQRARPKKSPPGNPPYAGLLAPPLYGVPRSDSPGKPNFTPGPVSPPSPPLHTPGPDGGTPLPPKVFAPNLATDAGAYPEYRSSRNQRICCLIGYSRTLGSETPDNDVPGSDPEIGSHDFGNQGDKVGYVYTDGAGLVDLGHLRDHVDQTLRIYLQLRDRQKSGREAAEIVTNHGRVRLLASIEEEDLLNVASAISYQDGLAYEFLTRDSQPGSSFSPEDLPSNYLGTVIARRAIQKLEARSPPGQPKSFDKAAFDKAATEELETALKDLDVRSRDVAQAAVDEAAAHHWFDRKQAHLFGKQQGYLLRRNFTSVPWNPVDGVLKPPWQVDSNGHPVVYGRNREKFTGRYGDIFETVDSSAIQDQVDDMRERFVGEDIFQSDTP